MAVLLQIEERKFETDNMFEPLMNIVELLKTYEVEFEQKVAEQVRVNSNNDSYS